MTSLPGRRGRPQTEPITRTMERWITTGNNTRAPPCTKERCQRLFLVAALLRREHAAAVGVAAEAACRAVVVDAWAAGLPIAGPSGKRRPVPSSAPTAAPPATPRWPRDARRARSGWSSSTTMNSGRRRPRARRAPAPRGARSGSPARRAPRGRGGGERGRAASGGGPHDSTRPAPPAPQHAAACEGGDARRRNRSCAARCWVARRQRQHRHHRRQRLRATLAHRRSISDVARRRCRFNVRSGPAWRAGTWRGACGRARGGPAERARDRRRADAAARDGAPEILEPSPCVTGSRNESPRISTVRTPASREF